MRILFGISKLVLGEKPSYEVGLTSEFVRSVKCRSANPAPNLAAGITAETATLLC